MAHCSCGIVYVCSLFSALLFGNCMNNSLVCGKHIPFNSNQVNDYILQYLQFMFGLGWWCFPIVQMTVYVTQRIGAIFRSYFAFAIISLQHTFIYFIPMLCVVVINIVICLLLDHCTSYLAAYFFDFFLFRFGVFFCVSPCASPYFIQFYSPQLFISASDGFK